MADGDAYRRGTQALCRCEPRYWRDRIYCALAQRAWDAGAYVIELQDIEDQMSPAEFELNPVDGHPNQVVHALIAGRAHDCLVAIPEILD